MAKQYTFEELKALNLPNGTVVVDAEGTPYYIFDDMADFDWGPFTIANEDLFVNGPLAEPGVIWMKLVESEPFSDGARSWTARHPDGGKGSRRAESHLRELGYEIPEPVEPTKPWHEAKVGEVWDVEASNVPRQGAKFRCIVDEGPSGLFFANGYFHRYIDNANITAAVRVWDGVA